MPEGPTTAAEGTLFVVSAASGTGKTSLVRALIGSDSNIVLSVSHTTRPKRRGETEGDHYHYVSEQQFQGMVDRGEFLEHARVFDHGYGTARAQVESQLRRGRDVILEIDWQGARQIRQRMPRCTSIFVLPPGLDQLEQRLRGRGQDDPEVIQRRMQAAVKEIAHYDEYDFLIVNAVFDTALAELRAVVISCRLALEGQRRRHAGLLRDLLAGWGQN